MGRGPVLDDMVRTWRTRRLIIVKHNAMGDENTHLAAVWDRVTSRMPVLPLSLSSERCGGV